jgi:hypothetical protein
MSERERLPKLKENSKLVKLKEEVNRIIEELSEATVILVTSRFYLL